MNTLVELIQEADLALMNMEQARDAVEAAKAAFEAAKAQADEAKTAFDQVIAKADEHAIPRGKLRKLAEERGAALMASGLISTPANQPRVAKPPRPKRAKPTKSEDLPDDFLVAEDEVASEASVAHA